MSQLRTSPTYIPMQSQKNLHSEDGRVIAHLKKHDKELFDIYTDATVKSMVRGISNKTLLDKRRGSLRKINSEMFFLGN